MIVANIHRPYRAQPKVKPNTARQRGMAAVMAALAAQPEGMSSDAQLALDARLAREADASKRRQGELTLRGAD